MFAVACLTHLVKGFRLTIRNVNYDEKSILLLFAKGFRLTIRNVNMMMEE